ncbi:TAXI family TRAP transporter solute-binding subunit [Niveispirillum cyanobacteriorum]|uniref:Immunogenic protein n=1 Tax=Niveispirillum cyanobacteriorum TaxID=1612173 RepID=A0A2K9NGK7_9PROT|nr:TAXI family TRAP transporter solute-binding subunit [Niveispirillum cyanobacteriorum]AUN32223.1 immunogenic protein [Niveispirillum cyanobacteriorum]GGE75335.1 C4-dicarboxylate ABC transporter substrate-binding protein [Niveispirillum cyanobacteriorum]
MPNPAEPPQTVPPEAETHPGLLRRRSLLAGGMALVTVSALPGLARAASEQVRFFQIGTGTTGGTYFLIGGLLANAVSNPPGSRPCDRGGACGVPGLIVVAQATSGAVDNIGLMRSRRLESALVQADIAHLAMTGQDPFQKTAYPDLRAIANLYTETIHLVTRANSGIKNPADLKGKRVALGEQGSGTLVTARALLATYGLSEKTVKPFYLSPAAGGDRLEAGELDAFLIVGGYPLPAVADLARRLPIALVPFDDARAAQLMKRMPHFTETRIDADTYDGVPATRTLGVGGVWVVRGDLKPELVHDITAALWNEQTRSMLDNGHPRGKSIQLATALSALPIPLHPGAERFYRAKGMIKGNEPAPKMPATH